MSNSSMFILHDMETYLIDEPNQVNDYDSLFSWRKLVQDQCLVNPVGQGECKDYMNPNYQLFYFNGIEDNSLTNDLVVLHHNNIALPISAVIEAEKRFKLARMLGKVNNKNMPDYAQGIYVAEYYRITRGINESIVSAYNYMAYGNGVFSNNSEFQFLLKEKLYREKNRKFSLGFPIDIRLVYFLPKEVLVENESVYVPKLNVVFTRKNPNREVYHPSSEIARKNIEGISIPTVSSVAYEIVRNRMETTDISTYYVKTGNSVEPIRVTLDPNREEGVFKRTYVNGVASKTEHCYLGDAASKFGIYPSKELAETNGDLSKKIELDKLENEKEKIKLDYNKITLEYQKIENDKKKLEFELHRMEEEKKMMEKRHEYEILLMGKKLEVTNLELAKRELEYLINKRKTMLEFEYQKEKIKHDLRMALLAHQHAKELHYLHMDKISEEMGVRTVNNIGNIASTLFTLLKVSK